MFSQSPYVCRMEWGRSGAREAAERGDIIIIVDILSFSSTVVSALHFGAVIYPYPLYGNGKQYAKEVNAEYILGRAEAAKAGKATLSPVSFHEEHSNKRYVLSSLNGAFCTWIASKAQALLIGSLLNAAAVASAANQLRLKTKANITVIPCGEQWSSGGEEEDTLRPAMEDYLGAGAILSYLEGEKSPEAEVCMGAFLQAEPKLDALIWDSGSSRELRERGFAADVEHCSRLNVYQSVPILKDNHFVTYKGELWPMEHIHIRQYQENDFNRIQELNHEEGWSNLVEKNDDTKEAWKHSNVTLVAEAEGEGIVGYIRGFTDTRITIYICELLIDKKYRGSGIGKKLLQYVHARYPSTRMELLASSTSHTFYESQGYRPFYGFRKTIEE